MPDWPNMWIDLSAIAAFGGIVTYAVLGGADFGGGVWDLFAFGERKHEQRLAIQKAMGPVWEANHVWLIFVLVILFTCFPLGFSVLSIALFLPFHLALLGIMLRGASFVFRSYQSRHESGVAKTSAWGIVFGVASTISPILLGMAFGVLTEGDITIDQQGEVVLSHPAPWLSPYSIANGLLALATCAYLAAVYLTNETAGPLREDFRARAIFAGTTTAVLAVLTLVFAWHAAPWFLRSLVSWRSMPVVTAGLLCFGGSAWSVFSRRYRLSRIFAIAEITLILTGWAVSQYPYLIYPDVRFAEAAAPTATLQFVVYSLVVAGFLLLPSLWLLFRIFKTTPMSEIEKVEQNPRVPKDR